MSGKAVSPFLRVPARAKLAPPVLRSPAAIGTGDSRRTLTLALARRSAGSPGAAALAWLFSGDPLSALVLASALLAAGAHAGEARVAPDPDSAEIPAELRDTLPGGSRLGDAPELPHTKVDVLPRPTQVRIHVKRQAPPAKD